MGLPASPTNGQRTLATWGHACWARSTASSWATSCRRTTRTDAAAPCASSTVLADGTGLNLQPRTGRLYKLRLGWEGWDASFAIPFACFRVSSSGNGAVYEIMTG